MRSKINWQSVIGNRQVFLLLALCFFQFGCTKKNKEILAENEYYVCSMDPQVMEKQPGMCPICKMPLAKITIDKTKMNIIKLNDEQMKLANVKVDTVRVSLIGKETSLTGLFAVNENKTEQVSARVNGRVEKLYRKIQGEEISAGEPLYDLYSRQLMLAQEEYLLALEKSHLLGGTGMISGVKNKLMLWGMTEKQISELEKTKQSKSTITIYSKVSGTVTDIFISEGAIVNEGTKIYQVTNLNSLWVEAQVYSGEQNLLAAGKKVEVIPEGMPEETTEGEVSFVNPELQSGSKINLVRIEVDNKRKKFKPGMNAYVILHSEMKKVIVLPTDAVIREGKHSIVWIQNGKGEFELLMVETGIENKDKVEILSGIKQGEIAVVSGTYLINSEYVFRNGMTGMGNMSGMKMDNEKGKEMDGMNKMNTDRHSD